MILDSQRKPVFLNQLGENLSPQMWVGGSHPQTKPSQESQNVDESTTTPEARRPTLAADDYGYIAKRLRELTENQDKIDKIDKIEVPANPIPVVDYNAYCGD